MRKVKCIKVDEADFQRVQNAINEGLKKTIRNYSAVRYSEMEMKDKKDGKWLIIIQSGLREDEIKRLGYRVIEINRDELKYPDGDNNI